METTVTCSRRNVPFHVYFSLIAPGTPTHHVLDSIPQFGLRLEDAPEENLSILMSGSGIGFRLHV
jgi:hypothetical protein